MKISLPTIIVLGFAAVLAFFTPSLIARQNQPEQQKLSSLDRGLARAMLRQITAEVKKHYYDPKFHGLDWNSLVRATEKKIDISASLNRALSEIAAALDTLNDSHTFMLPPPRPYKHSYGWEIQMVGDRCFVMQVRPKSDGESKGMKRGDEILLINGYQPTRENLWKMNYVFNILRPQPKLFIKLRRSSGQVAEIELVAAMRETKRVMDLTDVGDVGDIWDLIRELETEAKLGRERWVELGEDIGILKFHAFNFSQSEVDAIIKKTGKRKSLILDLRGNAGGSEDTLKWLLAGVFEKEVKIGDRITREASEPMVTKSKGKNAFSGKLLVLIDSKSASAAELFARVVQLEKRGILLGDKTAGAVMEARQYSYRHGVDTVVLYGASITEADIIMTDGKSLEHTGVMPDELLIPTASDLANNRDPVLARAVELCGSKITPEAADALFPFEWSPR